VLCCKGKKTAAGPVVMTLGRDPQNAARILIFNRENGPSYSTLV
jgi:hypothetical protein